MPRRNISIRAKDEEVFQQFERIVGGTGKFSDAIAGLVKKFVAEHDLIECIVTNDRGQLVTKAFRGRWLISLQQPWFDMVDVFSEEQIPEGVCLNPYWAVAQGEKGGWFVLSAQSKEALSDAPTWWRQLARGPNDPQAVEIPAEVIRQAKSVAASLDREEIEL
jgi:hypothetical protein